MNFRLFKSLLLILSITLFTLGCHKKKEDPTPSGPTSYDFQAKVNGVLKQTNILAVVTSNIVSIGGTFGDQSISMSTDKPPTVGTFQLKSVDYFNDINFGGMYDDGTTTYKTNDGSGSGSGTLTITKVTLDNNGNVTALKGTFSFTAYNGANSVEITEGVINY